MTNKHFPNNPGNKPGLFARTSSLNASILEELAARPPKWPTFARKMICTQTRWGGGEILGERDLDIWSFPVFSFWYWVICISSFSWSIHQAKIYIGLYGAPMRVLVWAYIQTLTSPRFHNMSQGFCSLRPLCAFPLRTYEIWWDATTTINGSW